LSFASSGFVVDVIPFCVGCEDLTKLNKNNREKCRP